jgi:hypothetical protein
MPERHRGADIANGYFDFMGVAMSALGCDFNREVSITVDVLSVHQTELSRDCGRIIVIASLAQLVEMCPDWNAGDPSECRD